MRACLLVSSVTIGVLAFVGHGTSAPITKRELYVSLVPGQCVIAIPGDFETTDVVSCGDRRHDVEIYAVEKGGWGRAKTPPPSVVDGKARSLCLAAYTRITGHALPNRYNWHAFWINSGPAKARYTDTIICGLATPTLSPLGSGLHYTK